MLSFVFLFCVSGCTICEDAIANSLGKISKAECFRTGFQESREYAKYSYKDVDFTNNSYFKQMTEADEEQRKARSDVFEQWVEVIKEGNPDHDLVVHYDFDASVISENDYLYINDSYEDSNDPMFSSFQVYFFDVDTMILYCFQTNV